MAVQSHGKTIAAGNTSVAPWTNGNHAFALARYNTDGTLDSSFDRTPVYNSKGRMMGYRPTPWHLRATAAWWWAATSTARVAWPRFTSNGALDTTFGAGASGTVLMPNATSPDIDSNAGVDQISIDATTGYITFACQFD